MPHNVVNIAAVVALSIPEQMRLLKYEGTGNTIAHNEALPHAVPSTG